MASTCKNKSCEKMFAYAYAGLRIILGLEFFYAGWLKLTTDWTAAGYLGASTGPFADFFQSLAGNGLVDALNAWGLLLIGLALIFGVGVRLASKFAIIMMVLYYFAQFEQNTAHGLIDQHVVYVFVFAMFAAGGGGKMFGLHNGAASSKFAKNNKWVRKCIE